MEIDEFREEFRNRVRAWAEADSNFTQAAFVDVAIDFLSDAGEVSDFEPCYYRGTSKTRKIAIDGYAFDKADDSLRLFVASSDDFALGTLTFTEANTLFTRLRVFAEDAITGGLDNVLDENSKAREFADRLAAQISEISRVHAYVLTDGLLSIKARDFPEGSIAGVPVEFHIWDIGRFYRAFTSKTGQDELEVKFPDDGLPCISASTDGSLYAGYLCVIPGSVLAEIYSSYGSRLLEGNVRSFLSTKGKVNRGIRNTVNAEPDMFFAYNNGIAATASSVKTEISVNGMRLLSAKDLQIVNGGQTTATLAASLRGSEEKLKRTFVPMKLSVIEPERANAMIPLISRYANSQNKVSEADFFSNHPYHRKLEQLSRRLWAPAKPGAQIETHWFYERARGQYINEPASLRETQRKTFAIENPRNQLVLKTDLAKVALSWQEMPQRVSRGAQSAFMDFATEITSRWDKNADVFDDGYFKEMIAKVIAFRATERIVSDQTWYLGGYRANIVTYAIAKLTFDVKASGHGGISFARIWDRQSISDAFGRQIAETAKSIFDVLTDPPEGQQNVTQWCKRDACWERVQRVEGTLRSAFIAELISAEEGRASSRVAREQQEIDSGIDAQTAVVSLGTSYWENVLAWSKKQGSLSSADERSLMAAAGQYGTLPSDRQSKRLLQLKKLFESQGYYAEHTVGLLEARIAEVEGFSVKLRDSNGADVRSDRKGIPLWPYERAARSAWSVADWKRERFTTSYENFSIDVLDGSGNAVHGLTKLENVRESYFEDE